MSARARPVKEDLQPQVLNGLGLTMRRRERLILEQIAFSQGRKKPRTAYGAAAATSGALKNKAQASATVWKSMLGFVNEVA